MTDTPAEPLPAPPAAAEPEPAVPEPDVPAPVQSASNESPQLPVSAQAAAARTHALLTHLESVISGAKSDIERFVPASLISAAEAEAQAFIKGML